LENCLQIRQEKPSDYDEVCDLVKLSFASNPDNDGTTHEYVRELREKDTFIPELSLVAEDENGKIAGFIVLYEFYMNAEIEAKTESITALLLSPICVHPDYFRRGIARAMIDRSFFIAKEMGYKAVFLCGDPDIYAKFGFRPSFEYGIFHVDDARKNAPWCMAYELVDDALKGVCTTVDIV